MNWGRIYSLLPKWHPLAPLPGAWLKSGKSKLRRLKTEAAAQHKHQHIVAPLCSARCFVWSVADTSISHLFINPSQSGTRMSCFFKNISDSNIYISFCIAGKSSQISGGPLSHSAERKLRMTKESRLLSISAIAAGVLWWLGGGSADKHFLPYIL